MVQYIVPTNQRKTESRTHLPSCVATGSESPDPSGQEPQVCKLGRPQSPDQVFFFRGTRHHAERTFLWRFGAQYCNSITCGAPLILCRHTSCEWSSGAASVCRDSIGQLPETCLEAVKAVCHSVQNDSIIDSGVGDQK